MHRQDSSLLGVLLLMKGKKMLSTVGQSTGVHDTTRLNVCGNEGEVGDRRQSETAP